MQTIEEFLVETYGYKTAFEPFVAARLEGDLSILADNNSGIKFFIWFLKKSHGEQYVFYPGKIITTCGTIGIVDMGQLATWLSDFGNSVDIDAFLNIVDPRLDDLDLSTLVPLDIAQVEALTKEDAPFENHCQWHFVDNDYVAALESDLSHIIKQCPSDKFTYIKSKRDCEDFSRIFRGWLSGLGLGNLAVSYVEYNAYDVDGIFVFAHAVLGTLVKTDQGQIVFRLFEPQQDTLSIWNPNEKQPIFNNYVSLKIRRIVW